MLLINLYYFKDAYTKSFCLGKGFMLPWSHLGTFQLHRSGVFRWRSPIQSSWSIWGIFQSSFQCSLLWLLKKLQIPFFMPPPSVLFHFAIPLTLRFLKLQMKIVSTDMAEKCFLICSAYCEGGKCTYEGFHLTHCSAMKFWLK